MKATFLRAIPQPILVAFSQEWLIRLGCGEEQQQEIEMLCNISSQLRGSALALDQAAWRGAGVSS